MKKFKVGDEIWVRTKIIDIEGNSVRVTSKLTNGAFWVVSSDCKPVEPPPDLSKMGVEVVSESGVSSVKKSVEPKANAVFIAAGHNRIGTHGTAKHHSGNMFYFESLDGKFMIWCDRSDFEWLDPATHVPVEHTETAGIKKIKPDLSYYRRLAWNDTLQKGDIIFSSETLDFHEACITIGMKVEHVFSFVRDTFGSTLTFYRPIK